MKNNKPKTIKPQKLKLLQSAIFTMLLLLCLQVHSQRLTVSNTGAKILKDGNPITLRGVNFGNWLVWEGYMMNIEPGKDIRREKSPTQIRGIFKDLLGNDEAKIVNFENNWRNSYITNADFAQAKALGYNVIRIPFPYNIFWNSATGTVKNDGFVWLDKAVTWAKNNNIHVIFVLHTAPGYQSEGYTCDNPDGRPPMFWSDENNVTIASNIWRAIAERYRYYSGNEWIAGYDLLNEPRLDIQALKSKILPAYKKMTASIRAVDSNHLIFAEGNYYSSDFYDMLERWDPNLVFSNHYYGDQGEANPNPQLDLIKGQGTNLNIPLFVGEFGENELNWVRDSRIDYEAANVSWAFWAWKREYTSRSIYTYPGTPKWDALTNYIKWGGTKPSQADAITATNEICSKVLLSSCNLVPELQDMLRPLAPVGKLITLKNTRYVSSNNSVGAVTANRDLAQGWEKFTVVSAGDNKIALRDSNGKFFNSQNGFSPITSSSTAVNGWEAFDWVNIGGQIALKGFNGKFVSSEGGASSGMTCNREIVSGWESFNYASTTAKLSIEKNQVKDNQFAVYPNPVSDKLNFSVPEGFTKYTAQIFDLTGKQYSITKIDSNETTNSIDTNNLSDGVYVLRLENNSEIKSSIIIKKNN
jgi:aryl-phospho-beta-D-glucosidase BglC (GH1 family)